MMSCDRQFVTANALSNPTDNCSDCCEHKKGFARWSRVKRLSTLLFVALLVPDGAVGSYDIDSDV